MIPHLQIEKGIPIPPPSHLPRVKGQCSYCRGIPREGYKTCDTCLDGIKQNYKERKRQGLCGFGVCPNAPAEGHVTCQFHLDQNNKRIMELLDSRIAQGLCRQCGEPRIASGNLYCGECRARIGRHVLSNKARQTIREFWRLDAIKERRKMAAAAIETLRSERTKQMLRLRHGLIDGEDHTLESVGIRFGITRERVRQIEQRAYAILNALGVDMSFRDCERERSPLAERDRIVSPLRAKKDPAHRMVSEAIKNGSLVPQSCKDLNDDCKGRILAHHHDYDKPLDVEWVCRRHHAVAHGKQISGLAEQKVRYTFPSWLERAKRDGATSDYYDATAILNVLWVNQIPQSAAKAATGLSGASLAKIVRGLPVNMKDLLIVRRYIETLKAEKAA